MPPEPRQPLAAPVSFTTLDVERKEQPAEGIAPCLSGGGYRAMLFHVGVLWRVGLQVHTGRVQFRNIQFQ